MSRKSIFVCDIDNTVSGQYQRYLKFYDSTTKKILPQAFQEQEILRDKPIPGAVKAITRLSEKFRIVWLCARPSSQYEITYKWLTRNKFCIDDLILVGKRNDKIPVLIRLKPCVYVDDMKYNYDNMEPKPTTEFMKRLDENGINYEIFDNNWDEIADKYLRSIGCQDDRQ